MTEYLEVACPHCGELVELDLAPDTLGKLIQDCDVCCRPCEITVTRDEWGDPEVSVERSE